MDWKHSSNETAKKMYDSAMSGTEAEGGKGVHMYKRPYLWRDDTPCSHKDTPTENFIPTPMLNTNEEPKWKRIVTLALVGVVVLMIVVGFFIGLNW